MNREVWQAMILGVVQGITEFLPISSDGHLVVTQELMQAAGWGGRSEDNFVFDILLHLGTLGSIIVVYWRELWQLRLQPRLCVAIVIASIPAAVVGLLFKDEIEHMFAGPLYAGIGFLVTAFLLLIGAWAKPAQRDLDQLTMLDAIWIGCLQALAIAPGISRSGSTISTALRRGLRREAAATFSFLMAVPVIAGAVFVGLLKLRHPEALPANSLLSWQPLVFGTVTAFVVGIFALRGLLRILVRGKWHWFAVYCLIAGCLTIAWALLGGQKPSPETSPVQARAIEPELGVGLQKFAYSGWSRCNDDASNCTAMWYRPSCSSSPARSRA